MYKKNWVKANKESVTCIWWDRIRLVINASMNLFRRKKSANKCSFQFNFLMNAIMKMTMQIPDMKRHENELAFAWTSVCDLNPSHLIILCEMLIHIFALKCNYLSRFCAVTWWDSQNLASKSQLKDATKCQKLNYSRIELFWERKKRICSKGNTSTLIQIA